MGDDMDTRFEQAQEEIEALTLELEHAKDEIDVLQEELDDLEDSVEERVLEARREGYKEALENAMNAIEELK